MTTTDRYDDYGTAEHDIGISGTTAVRCRKTASATAKAMSKRENHPRLNANIKNTAVSFSDWNHFSSSSQSP
jgi:hypothetical protein